MFKVGDKVKLKEDLVVDKVYGGITFNDTMEELKGRILTVSKDLGFLDMKIKECGAQFYYSASMFEEVENVENEENQKLFTVRDLIDYLENNEIDLDKPVNFAFRDLENSEYVWNFLNKEGNGASLEHDEDDIEVKLFIN